MVPRRLRLPRAGFRAPRNAKRSGTEHFSLIYYVSEPKLGGCAVIIPKKAVPKAVDRHTLKRQIFAALIPHSSQQMAHVVYAKKGVGTLSAGMRKAELAQLFSSL
jgi:ribonuclease P protein component